MHTPKLILFDWDNTLAISRDAVVYSINSILKKYNLEEWETTKRQYRDKNLSFKDNFPNFFGKNAEKAYQEYLSFYKKEALSKVQPQKNAYNLLKNLQEQNIPFGILSNKDHFLLDLEVAQCFPTIKFDWVFGNNDFKRNKPYPDPIIGISKKLNIPQTPESIWLVGDSVQDTRCAINSGIQGILFGKGNMIDENEKQSLQKHNIIQIQSLSEISKIIPK
ncbi:MAG: HAD family hydrolase [Alphaproteobacteria bacterium]|nr:HAD family hydrolase [Alphaproteobacteria bacterium]